MTRPRWIARLVCVVLVAATAVAVGGEEDPDTELARRHFEMGRKFYSAAEYDKALPEFELARRYKPLPALDFNIGRCHDRLEHFSEAMAAYRRYIEAAPNAGDAAEVRERIKLLEERAKEMDRLTPVEVKPLPSLSPDPLYVRPSENTAAKTADASGGSSAARLAAPLAVGGGAVLVAVVGAALYGSVSGEYNQCKAMGGCVASVVAPLQSRAVAGQVLMVLAGAIAIADVVLWVLTLTRKPAPAARVKTVRGPQWRGLTLTF